MQQLSLPEEIKKEYFITQDLLEVSEYKPQLKSVALLIATMALEKTLRIVLYTEYKTISKIKFSVLIDKAQQKGYFDKEMANELRMLKNNRNTYAHVAAPIEGSQTELIAVTEILNCIQSIFEIYTDSALKETP